MAPGNSFLAARNFYLPFGFNLVGSHLLISLLLARHRDRQAAFHKHFFLQLFDKKLTAMVFIHTRHSM